MADIEARENDLRTLYAGANVERRRAVLDRWGVRWVAVGDLERSTYGIVEDDPLSNVPGVRRLANRGADTVYLVRPLRRKGTIAR